MTYSINKRRKKKNYIETGMAQWNCTDSEKNKVLREKTVLKPLSLPQNAHIY
jgi:hypothetical protein